MQSILLSFLKHFATLTSGVGKQKKLIILIYHRVLDEPDFIRPAEFDKTAFTWQMELLANYFHVLPLHEALQKVQTQALPPRAIAITFDDGYADNYTNALPILKQFNLSATFFIASGFLNGGRMWNDTVIEAVRNFQLPVLDLSAIGLGRFDVAEHQQKAQAALRIIQQIRHLPPAQRSECSAYLAAQAQNLPDDLMMTTVQVKALHQSGMEIGGHTVTHPILAKLDDETARQEIIKNKTELESLINAPLRYFAYPNGKPGQDYQPRQSQMVKDAGYQAALSTRLSVVDGATDQWQLPRFTPWDSSSLKFMLRLAYKYHTT